MNFLKNPLTMWGRVERCWLLAFRAPLEEVQALLPAPLEAVSHGAYGFYNVVVCRIGHMRPWPLPEFLGFSYWHVAYRIYARFCDREGKEVEGLFFLRSDCDKSWLVPMGNWMTDFRFHGAKISMEEWGGVKTLNVFSEGGRAMVQINPGCSGGISSGSPFADLQEAGAFLKYKPRGIGLPENGKVQIVPIGRNEAEWKHRLVSVDKYDLEFFKHSQASLELCYEVESIPYVWNRGVTLGLA